jgi:hypothetical protein
MISLSEGASIRSVNLTFAATTTSRPAWWLAATLSARCTDLVEWSFSSRLPWRIGGAFSFAKLFT